MLLDILNPRSPGTVNGEGDAEGSATCDPRPGTAAQAERPGEGQPEGLGSRLSLHHQLVGQAPSSPSEGAMQPGEVRVGKFLGCPGTAAYSHSVNRKLSETHWEHRSRCPLQLHRREHSLVYQQTSSVCSHRKLFSTPEAEPQATSQIWHLSSEKDAKCIDLKTFCTVSESCSLHLHSGPGEQNPGPPLDTTVLRRRGGVSHCCLDSAHPKLILVLVCMWEGGGCTQRTA